MNPGAKICPRCGALRHSAAGVCPTCGYSQITDAPAPPPDRIASRFRALFSPRLPSPAEDQSAGAESNGGAVAGGDASDLSAPVPSAGPVATDSAADPAASPSQSCPHCGVAYHHQGSYCGRCGNPLGPLCPRCGSANDSRHQYCIHCGTALGSRAPRHLTAPFPRGLNLNRIATLPPVVAAQNALYNFRQALDYSDADFPLPASPRARLLAETGIVSALALTSLLILVWNNGAVPAGLAGDEGTIALESMRILSGEWIGLWTGVELGNPTLHYYLIALLFRLGGPTVEMLRFSSAFFAVALIPVGYLMVRMLFPFRVAVLFVVLLTFCSWFLIQGRIGFHITFMVFMAAASICLLLLAVRSGRPWIAVLGGLTLGLGLYSFKGFLIYFIAIWCLAALALLVSPELRRRWAMYLYLGVSLLVGAYLLEFYATSGYVGTNLGSYYGAPGLFDFQSHFKHALEILLYVHRPISDGGVDGAVGKPLLLSPFFALFFWAGLLTVLLFINRRPYQLLLLGWLIALAPAILVPGAESRRYLFGVFFLLILVAIGFNSVVHLLTTWLRRRRPGWFDASGLHAVHGIAAGAMLCFVLLFSALSLNHFYGWPKTPEARWFFAENIAGAARFLDSLDDNYEVRFYSSDIALDNEIVQWLAPGRHGHNGSAQFGGDGAITSGGPIAGDTAFLLLDEYLPLASDLQSAYPDGEQIRMTDAAGNLLYIAHLVPGALYYDPSSENYRPPARLTPTGAQYAGRPPVGGARVEPDPTQLAIRAAPTEHHPVHLVTAKSSMIVPSPDARLVIHNDPSLPGADACRELERRPEGDTRLLIILPKSGREVSSLFYLVGCAPGEAALYITSGDELLTSYSLTIAAP